MLDVTQLIFKSSVWLLIGIVLYYILSAAKVFLLVKIQPQLFHSYGEVPKLSVEKLFPQYTKQFIRDGLLHRFTISYLINKGGKASWKLVGNKKINFYYNFLNAITVMLKPFLIVAILWAILKFLILKRIAYDELQVSLGQIQTIIAYLKSLKIVDIFDHYKVWFFVLIVIVCGILGVVKKFEANINRSKSIIYSCFTIFSILAGLTFFGSDLSKTKNDSLQKLGDLNLEVKKIHENIYRDVAKIIVYEDLSQAINDDVKNNEQESQRLDTLHNKAFEIITRQEIKSELLEKFNTQNEEYKKLVSLEVAPKTPNQSNPKTEFVFSDFMEEYFHNFQSNKNTTTQDYWTNQNNWNKGNGLDYAKSVEELKSQPYFTGETESQVRVVVENVVDYIGEEFINKIAEFFSIENLELPKSIASFLTIEKCKECFVPRIANAIKTLGNKVKAVNELKTFSCFKKRGNSAERINSVKSEHNKTYNEDLAKAEKEQKIANANEKLDRLINDKVDEILKEYGSAEFSNVDYTKFRNQITEDYKTEINFNDLSVKQYDKLISSTSVLENVFKTAMAIGASMPLHPGPRAGCPLCAYLNRNALR